MSAAADQAPGSVSRFVARLPRHEDPDNSVPTLEGSLVRTTADSVVIRLDDTYLEFDRADVRSLEEAPSPNQDHRDSTTRVFLTLCSGAAIRRAHVVQHPSLAPFAVAARRGPAETPDAGHYRARERSYLAEHDLG